MKVLVTPRSFGSTSSRPKELLEEKGYELIYNDLDRPYKKEEMLEIVKELDGIIIGIDYFGKEIIEEASKLRVISKYGVGVDNINLDKAAEKNIVVTNTPTANNDAVADLAFAHMMALARRIPEADRETKAGKWKKIIGKSVWGKTLGVIGLGKIGRALVKRARGFNMDILAFDVYADQGYAVKNNVHYVELGELYQQSDFISIHTPLNEATKNIISTKELKEMKNSAFLINTSRGGIVDEEALYHALKSGEIKGAALDAYVNEPPEGSPLRKMDNVIMTSHNGAYTEEAIANMGIQAAENLISILKGEKLDKEYIVK